MASEVRRQLGNQHISRTEFTSSRAGLHVVQLDANGAITNGRGTEYTDGDTDTTPSGMVAMFINSSNTTLGGGRMRLAYDLFTEGSDTTLASHVPDSGGLWVKHPATPSGSMTVIAATDRVTGATSSAETLYYHNQPPISPDYLVQAILRRSSTDTSGYASLYLRCNSTQNTNYGIQGNPVTGVWVMFKVVNGSVTQLGTAGTMAINTDYLARVLTIGSRQRFIVDGTQLVATADTSILAAGFGAIISANNAQVDDFVLEDWRLLSGQGAG